MAGHASGARCETAPVFAQYYWSLSCLVLFYQFSPIFVCMPLLATSFRVKGRCTVQVLVKISTENTIARSIRPLLDLLLSMLPVHWIREFYRPARPAKVALTLISSSQTFPHSWPHSTLFPGAAAAADRDVCSTGCNG